MQVKPQAESARQAIKGLLSVIPTIHANWFYRQMRSACKSLGTPADKATRRLRGGGSMRLDLRDVTQRGIFYCGFHEPRVMAGIAPYLPDGGVFVDVGANIGYYTIWATGRVGKQGRVYSFEPNPVVYADLKANVELNDCANVKLMNCAVGAVEATAALNVDPSDSGLSFVSSKPAAATAGSVTIHIDTIDEWVRSNAITRIDLMKIDVEGYEMEVIRGAVNTLETLSPHLIMEVADAYLKRAGSSDSELLMFLQSKGYSIYDIRITGKLSPYDPSRGGKHGRNLFFIPLGKPVLSNAKECLGLYTR